MRLLVISHTPHYLRLNTFVGWGPTIRELDYLAGIFEEIVHLAPLYSDVAPESSMPYSSQNIRFHPIKPAGGEKIREKLNILVNYPTYAREILQLLGQVDVVHVRCPANISLLAILLLAISRKPLFRWVKYAGNWTGSKNEPWSYKIQRFILSRNWHRGSVSINGRWPEQPGYIYTFPNPSLENQDITLGLQAVQEKKFGQPLQLLFVGRVETEKGAGRVLEIGRQLYSAGVAFHLDVIGDGPEKSDLCKWAVSHSLDDKICFHGWLPKDTIKNFYRKAHFLLLPSTASEGWPKVLSEAMAFGAVPIAGAVSSIPQILSETQAGFALDPVDIAGYVKVIQSCLEDPAKWRQASISGNSAAAKFTYFAYLKAVKKMFHKTWGIILPCTSVDNS